MPGSPPTSPRFTIPRYADGDTASFSVQVNAITDAVDANAAHLGKGEGYLPGDLIESFASTRAGAVLCDGTAYTLSAHPEMNALAAACPALVSGGVLTVPDARGRTVVGAGTGPGLTARSVGQKFGEESHKLLAAESGVNGSGSTGTGTTGGMDSNNPHSHTSYTGPTGIATNLAGGPGGNVEGGIFATDINHGHPIPSLALNARDADSFHNNIQPSLVANIFIKL